MSTTNLLLEKPAYQSDGQTAVEDMNTNMDSIDDLIPGVLCYEGDILTYENELLITAL